MSAIKVEHTYNTWHPIFTMSFNRCADTNKLIWPFTVAYYTDYIDVNVRIQLRSPSVGRWITPKAYMFRKLRGDAE